MNKILVTGGTGYIGSHTVVELLQAGYEVEIIDNLFNSKIEVLDKIEQITNKRPLFHEVDLLDKEATLEVLKNGSFDAALHFAGLKAVGASVQKPPAYKRPNLPKPNISIKFCVCLCFFPMFSLALFFYFWNLTFPFTSEPFLFQSSL